MNETRIPSVEKQLIDRAYKMGLTTGRDRLLIMSPQCGFGELGLCCRQCYMGPCRIDPFGSGPEQGICGATADTIVARNLLREITGGAASHVGHAREVAITLLKTAKGEIKGYSIKDPDKLKNIAGRLGVETDEKDINELAVEVVSLILSDFGRMDGSPSVWLKARAPKKEFKMWEEIGIVYSNPHIEFEMAMHRTSMGNDADPMNLLLAGLRMGLVDGYSGLHLATDLQDVLFGTPKPVKVEANIGVLEENSVNIAMHGHNPLLSEKILEWSEKLEDEARKAGAERINVVGVCCTGNELTMRHGVPMAAHNLQSELILHTGVVDEMVVDIQCIWPYSTKITECYGTAFVTTDGMVKIPGAKHMEFEHENPDESAREIVLEAIEAFKRRKSNGKDTFIPSEKTIGLAGLSVESLLSVLKNIDEKNPLKPVIDNIVNGNILGAVGFAGCPSLKFRDTAMTERMVKELLKNNVLVVTTGCTAHILAQAGMMDSVATERYCGDGLRKVLEALGEAAGLKAPLPPVWHMGSCVDNSRIADLLSALADYLDVKISQLPVAASAPELVQEKAISIGTWVLALGITLHVAPAPRILGSPLVTKVLTEDLANITGGRAYVEYNPEKAAQGLISFIREKRKALKI